jgi:hypothetical protein
LKSFKLFLLLIAFSSFVIFINVMGSSPSQNLLLQDIFSVKLTGSAQIDISKIIQEHIPIGATKEDSLNIFEAAGFKIYKQDEKNLRSPPPSSQADELFIVVLKYKKMAASHHEARALVYFNQGIVSDISGNIIYRAL